MEIKVRTGYLTRRIVKRWRGKRMVVHRRFMAYTYMDIPNQI